MSVDCDSSLNGLSPYGILDDGFAVRHCFASGGEIFNEETHLEGVGQDDFMMDDLSMDSNYGDFVSGGENTEVSLTCRVFLNILFMRRSLKERII